MTRPSDSTETPVAGSSPGTIRIDPSAILLTPAGNVVSPVPLEVANDELVPATAMELLPDVTFAETEAGVAVAAGLGLVWLAPGVAALV